MNTYAGYVQCDYCAVYDSDPGWCVLCGKLKKTGQARLRPATDGHNRRTSALSPRDSGLPVEQSTSRRSGGKKKIARDQAISLS